ncbi:MAG: amidohydrolase [candidate division WS1 bacterium]|jgi:predicted TIM-barrel fold metal-dependent hydrolase|nr:amidohydrolase [candidate division WS1 bacterium]
MTKIDAHAHLGMWNFPIPGCGTVDNLLRLCEKHSIEYTTCSSSMAILYDMQEGNAELAEAVSDNGPILGYVYVNPNFIPESVAEMERYLPESGFVGVKIYTGGYSGVTADMSMFAEMVAEVAKRASVMLVHTPGAVVIRQLSEYGQRHPTLNIIMGHAGASDWPVAAHVAATQPNMYLEFCSSWAGRGKIEQAVQICGAQQILFGSDMDLIDPAFVIGQFEDAGLTDEQKQMVYYDNATRLFGIA